ncbi:MAG TPA: DJ-1/PfpI family protein [Terracidiphilus sp.]|nr:DJ-1/PfpI family protein [Terracidiphilus sp.]
MTRGLCAVLAFATLFTTLAAAGRFKQPEARSAATTPLHSLKPPAGGAINAAFLVSENTTLIDFAGPWDVFVSTMLTSQGQPWRGGDDMVMPFNIYTVSDSRNPISAEGVEIVPRYTFQDAPKPQVIVIPAQGGRSDAQKSWLLKNSQTADITMSVCTGASMLAAYGLLDHQKATTHHMFLNTLQSKYPAVQFVSGIRYIDNGRIATAAGETSGIDLALHVVERYYGREVAQATADFIEYKGDLWKNPQYGEVHPAAASR